MDTNTHLVDDILACTFPEDNVLLFQHSYMDLAILHRKHAKYGQMYPNAENKSKTIVN